MAQMNKDLAHIKRASMTTTKRLQEKEELLEQVGVILCCWYRRKVVVGGGAGGDSCGGGGGVGVGAGGGDGGGGGGDVGVDGVCCCRCEDTSGRVERRGRGGREDNGSTARREGLFFSFVLCRAALSAEDCNTA